MSLRRLSRLALVFGTVIAPAARAASDLAPPKLREKIVADAASVIESRNAPEPLPSPLPNPFVVKEDERPDVPAASSPEPAMENSDLLAILAARIPATGTVSIGGEPLLLLGQKRLKVGDTVTISFEGQTYELSIASVSSTSFTVKRGENIHTRPVRISASTTTPTNRP